MTSKFSPPSLAALVSRLWRRPAARLAPLVLATLASLPAAAQSRDTLVLLVPDDAVASSWPVKVWTDSAARPLMSGQTLRQGMVRPAQLFKPGAPVKLLAGGVGFQVTSYGQALSGGGPGQTVRVRMDNGRIVSGTVNAQGDVVIGQ